MDEKKGKGEREGAGGTDLCYSQRTLPTKANKKRGERRCGQREGEGGAYKL